MKYIKKKNHLYSSYYSGTGGGEEPAYILRRTGYDGSYMSSLRTKNNWGAFTKYSRKVVSGGHRISMLIATEMARQTESDRFDGHRSY